MKVYSFEIKFIIFNNMPLTEEQNKIREKMCEMKEINNDLKKILKESCCELNYMIKFLDRLEPAICSLDGNKQLRMSLISLVNQNKKDSNSIIFNQNHPMCKKYFNIEELTIISLKIKEKIENYLHYEIPVFKLLTKNGKLKKINIEYNIIDITNKYNINKNDINNDNIDIKDADDDNIDIKDEDDDNSDIELINGVLCLKHENSFRQKLLKLQKIKFSEVK